MGLLDDYGIDYDEVPDAPDYSIEDGTYPFTIGNFYLKDGSENHPDKTWLIIEYLLGDEGKRYSEFFTMPQEASAPTEKELQALSFFKRRLASLGVPRDAWNNIDEDDLVGLEGVVTLRTRKGYQNISTLKVEDEPEEAEEEAPKPARRSPAKQAVAAQAKAADTAVANPFAGSRRRGRGSEDA